MVRELGLDGRRPTEGVSAPLSSDRGARGQGGVRDTAENAPVPQSHHAGGLVLYRVLG